jgi:hypothetical protein
MAGAVTMAEAPGEEPVFGLKLGANEFKCEPTTPLRQVHVE